MSLNSKHKTLLSYVGSTKKKIRAGIRREEVLRDIVEVIIDECYNCTAFDVTTKDCHDEINCIVKHIRKMIPGDLL